MFILEIVTADSIGSYFSGQVSDLLFKYVGQSFQNTISAFMWPVYVIELDPIWGAAILAAMFFLFPRILKEPLERWLFDSSDVDRPATTEQD